MFGEKRNIATGKIDLTDTGKKKAGMGKTNRHYNSWWIDATEMEIETEKIKVEKKRPIRKTSHYRRFCPLASKSKSTEFLSKIPPFLRSIRETLKSLTAKKKKGGIRNIHEKSVTAPDRGKVTFTNVEFGEN